MRHFLTTSDFTKEKLDEFVLSAMSFKRGEHRSSGLAGHSIALVFFNPSLRTRASMQVAAFELGGNAIVLEPGSTSWSLEHRPGAIMDSDKAEHVSEFARVLGRYCACVCVRSFAAMKNWSEDRMDPMLQAFAQFSQVPVINLESAMYHPCQAMADMMTIREKLGAGKKRVLLTWAWHPKALPMAVPNSFALAAAQTGHDLVIAHPAGYDLDEDLMNELQEHSSRTGGKVRVTDDGESAYDGVDVVYAKSWGSKLFYGDTARELETRAPYRGHWMVNKERMSRTKDALFMHCLPVRRNVIVTDEVLDSSASIVIDEAENRLHMQKAILLELLGHGGA